MSGYEQGFEDSDTGQQIKARLKWFNATKGFGFVSPVDGSSDAFLHVSVLHRAGLQDIGEQAELLCEVGSGPKGPQVTRIVEILDPGQAPQSGSQSSSRGISQYSDGQVYPRAPSDGYGGRSAEYGAPRGGADRYGAPPPGPEEQATGTVKWFKTDKGFGFITVDDSGQDVFVHKSVLQRSGLSMLESGQRVELRIQQVEKGREATWVALS